MFIAIEGCEGAGKTSVISAIKDKLEQQGRQFVITREPGGTPDAENIRSILVQANQLSGVAQTLMFAAARTDHVDKVIRPALDEGMIVVTDRYLLSTIAYQGAASGVSQDFILDLHLKTSKIAPDLTIVLDVHPETGLARSLKRLHSEGSSEGHFEAQELSFHENVRQAMLDWASSHDNHIVVDAGQPQEAVIQTVLNIIEQSLS